MNKMSMWRTAGLIVASLAALAIAWPGASEACTCVTVPFEAEFAATPHVFSGRVLGHTYPENASYPDHHYEIIQVDAVWKGTISPVMEVLVPNNDGICGFYFTAGSDVVVFADVYEDGSLYTVACDRSGSYAPGDVIWQQLGPPLSTPTVARSWGKIKASYHR
jgi:hypothetical protein